MRVSWRHEHPSLLIATTFGQTLASTTWITTAAAMLSQLFWPLMQNEELRRAHGSVDDQFRSLYSDKWVGGPCCWQPAAWQPGSMHNLHRGAPPPLQLCRSS